MPKFTQGNRSGEDTRFAPGRSNNPLGRPKRVDTLRREIARELERHGAALTRMAVQRALAGDAAALVACMSLLAATAEPRAEAEKSSTA
ncbi:DUF5681 domain-containing protein [Burkholderia glumae]|uniref:DUF5681 domain-containing protein n=1 Tax=Burkholderia glumae TaxID=337 RepID=UPI0021518147|nr:DUF5681 domain-containing protein [Burkholderia glumae]UVS96356.1 hypothetical protein EFP19_11750 [Burkholderia glumae]